MERETNIRVPLAAMAALDAIAGRADASRATTLRRLLARYVEAQSALNDDSRSTHISTVLRYPLLRRRGVVMLEDAVPARQLRVRADADLLANARDLSFRLPGQPPRRGHSDYQARSLTDAVMTAIAAEELITDEFLSGLVPVLTHRAALELWHLAVEYTVTPAERRALAYDGHDSRMRRTAEILLDDLEAWHHDRRTQVVRHFARTLLSGAEGPRMAAVLAAGRLENGWLEDQALDLRENADPTRNDLVAELPVGWNFNGREGRGGTAVWRAAHRAALEELPAWLRRLDAAPFKLDEGTGWELQRQPRWLALDRFPATMALPEPWGDHAEAGRVLWLRDGRWHVLWPVSPSGGPVARFAQVTQHQAVGTLEPASVVELLLTPLHVVRVPRHYAVEWGLISEDEFNAIGERAEADLRRGMTATLKRARARLSASALDELAGSRSYPAFLATCRRFGVEFEEALDTTWPWPIDSLAEALAHDDIPDGALAWLVDRAIENWQAVNRDAQHTAWEHAFWRPDRHPR